MNTVNGLHRAASLAFKLPTSNFPITSCIHLTCIVHLCIFFSLSLSHKENRGMLLFLCLVGVECHILGGHLTHGILLSCPYQFEHWFLSNTYRYGYFLIKRLVSKPICSIYKTAPPKEFIPIAFIFSSFSLKSPTPFLSNAIISTTVLYIAITHHS